MSPFLRKCLLAALLILGASLRFYRLDELPPGLQFDQAYYVLDALFLLHGDFHIFFREPGRSEPLFQYLLIPFVALFGGDTPLGPKITASLLGTATIFLVYGLTHALFRATGRALLAALFTTISFWHIFYCRYGERIPLTLFFATLTFWFFWRALTVSEARFQISRSTRLPFDFSRWREYVLSGVFTGVNLYTYPSARSVPFALVFITAYVALTDRARAAYYLQGLVLAGIIATMIFLPLGVYYLQHPLDFISHTAEVSIFVPHGEVSDDVLLELGKNALKIAGMFFVVGDAGVLRNLPYRPIFDPFVGALFVVGVAVWMTQLVSRTSSPFERTRAVFLAVWLGLALVLSLLSDDAPNNGRTLIGLPVVMLLPAWGVQVIWERFSRAPARRIVTLALTLVIATSTGLMARDYFVVFANDPGTYYAFDVDKVELSQWVNRNASTHHLYLAPVIHQIGTVMLLTRYAPVKSFDSRDTLVLPARTEGKDALYVFPAEQEKRAQTMLARLGALGAREQLIGSNGALLGWVVRVPAQNLPALESPLSALSRGGDFLQPQRTTRAVWGDVIELLGYSVEASDAAKRNLEVTLFLRAVAPMNEDYTFSVKVRDGKGRVWGQEDKWAGTNSYATTRWSVGDVVIERFYSGLSACASAGEYRLTVEAYEPRTMRVLALTNREGAEVELGVWRAEASPGNLYEHLEPEQRLDAKIGEQLRLMGYTLSTDQVHRGDEFSLLLFWRGVGRGNRSRVIVQLKSAAEDVLLADADIMIPAEGRGLCSLFDVRVPTNFPVGMATLSVNGFKIGEIKITP